MGNDIQVTSTMSGKTKVFKLTKKDSSGQDLTMTATIFDRNKSDNQMKNADAPPSGMIIDSNDAIQFGGKDLAQFTASDVASVQCALFEGYDNTEYEKGSVADKDVQKQWSGNKVSGITLDSGKNAIKLGQFKAALEDLSPADCSQNQSPASGVSKPATEGGNGVPMPQNFFQMSIPDIRGLSNIMEESGFRGCMLMPDLSATPYVMCADLDRALDAVFKPFMMNVKTLMERSSGGYVPNSTPSGQTSGSDSVSPADAAAAKKAKEAEDAAKKAEEAEEKAKKEAIEAAKKKREEEVAGILKDLYDSMKMWGTDEEALKTAIGRIKKDNVLEVLETWEKSPYAEKMGSKSLIEVIDGETNGIIWSDADEYLKPIAEKLNERSGSNEAKLRADLINSDFATGDVKKLYEIVRAEQKEDKIKDPIDVKIERQFEAKKEAENALKEKNQKAVTKAKEDATKAKQELDNATKLTALKKEAIDKFKIVTTNEDTIETVTAKMADAKAKKNKKPLTKAEKAQQKLDLETARQEQLAEARRNEELAKNVKAAAEKVRVAEEAAKNPKATATPVLRTPEGVRAANERAHNAIKEDKVHNEDTTPWWHVWGKKATKFTRDHIAPPVVVTPKAEPTQAQSPATAATANPERDAKIAEYKEVMKKFNKARENQGQHPEETAALQKELEGLDKQLLDLHVSREEINAIK